MFLKPWFLLGTPGLCSRGAWQRYMFLAMLRGMILPTEPQNVCGVSDGLKLDQATDSK